MRIIIKMIIEWMDCWIEIQSNNKTLFSENNTRRYKMCDNEWNSDPTEHLSYCYTPNQKESKLLSFIFSPQLNIVD